MFFGKLEIWLSLKTLAIDKNAKTAASKTSFTSKLRFVGNLFKLRVNQSIISSAAALSSFREFLAI